MSSLKKLLFSLLVLLSPTQLAIHFWPSWSLVNGTRIDYLSPTFYLTDFLILFLILLHLKNLRISRKHFLVFISLSFINIFLSLSPAVSAYRFLKLNEFILLGYIVFQYFESFSSLIRQILPFTLVWTCVLAILQWINNGSLNGLWYWLGERNFTTQTPGIALSKLFSTVSLRPYATLPHPNVLAAFLILGWIIWMQVSPIKSVFFWAITVLLAFVVLLTESYTSWFALISVGIFFQVQKRSPFLKKNAWPFLVTFCFVVSILTPFVFSSFSEISRLPQNIRERMELSYLSGFTFSRNPLFGVGLGTFITTVPHYFALLPNSYHVRTIQLLQPIHNIPLLVMTETGIVGLITLFSVLFVSVPTPALVFFLVTGLFDHYWLTLQSPMLLLSIAVGLQLQTFKNAKVK